MRKCAPSNDRAWLGLNSRVRSGGAWSVHLLCSLTLSLSAIISVGATQSQPDLAEGQEWSIKSQPPTTAKIVVDRIEQWKHQTVVHISIINIPKPASQRGIPVTQIDHIPFEKTALTASVDKLLSTGVAPPPNFETGYRQWKENNGGIYTIPVTQVLATILVANE
jgi:hypothetical protein